MRILVLFFSLALVCSCTKKLNPNELTNWLTNEDNGCLQSQDLTEYKMTSQFLPSDYMAFKQFHILEERYNDSSFNAIKEQYDGGIHFILSFDFSNNVQNAKEFIDDNIEYLSFFIEKDFLMITNGDSIPCSMANLERSANFSSKINIEMAFTYPISQIGDSIQLLYQGYLSREPVSMIFHKSKIRKTPKIKF